MNLTKKAALVSCRAPFVALCLLVVCLSGCASAATPVNGTAPAPALPGGFVLQDYAGHVWRNERVTFPLTPAELQEAKAGKELSAPDGTPALYQIVPGAKPRIAFMADLDAFQKRVYTFSDRPSSAVTDLKVDDTGDLIRVTNGHTGISIRKQLNKDEGPIEGVELASGTWVGGSRIANNTPVTKYTATVVARGPAYAEVYCRVEWGASQWHLRFRLDANEPVVLVDENSSVTGDNANFTLSLSDNFNPDHLFYRLGKATDHVLNYNMADPLAPGQNFIFEPWLHWGASTKEGAFFSVYRDGGSDMLSVGARNAADWIDPTRPGEEQASVQSFLTQDAAGLHMDFGLRKGKREWMLAALDKTASLSVMQDEKLRQETPLPYTYFIKHADFPLDEVKEWQCEWKANDLGPASYPRLMYTRKDLDRFRKSIKDPKPFLNAAPNYIADPNGLNQFNMEPKITAWFATGDKKLGRYLADNTLTMAQSVVDGFLVQRDTTYGAAPQNHQDIGTVALLADAVLSGTDLTAEQRSRLLGQMAFISYSINQPSFWSTDRGYAGFPNMTTSVYGYRATYACLIPSHPLSPAWVKDTLATLKAQLDTWSDENGGWLEAPHYAMVGYDQILAVYVMAHNAGLDNNLYTDPKVKTIIRWFAKISTPPDSRYGGFRHLPPIGNTYMIEPTGEFGLVAFLFRDQDPAFASEMEWMFQQQKSYMYPGVGGSYPAFAGYRSLMYDSTIPATAPHYGSELFPETGVVLRNKYPTDRETYLYLIAGSHRSHYDIDQSSITLWGKGRILSDDFGYYGQAPAEDSSELDSAFLNEGAHVSEIVKGDGFEYVDARQSRGGRQIVFVKDDDPLAPNYFVVCDSQKVPSPAAWRLWLTAQKVELTPGGATVTGKEDVDMDCFFPLSAPVNMSTEEKTRTAGSGVNLDGRQGRVATTQTGIIASAPNMAGFTAVLYPRLKIEKPPTFTSLAGGKAVKVESGAGTDYVFLAPAAFKFDGEGIQFEGSSGLVKIRGDKTSISLGADGTLSAGGKTITRGNAHPAGAKQAAYDQAINGDFESGQQTVFQDPGPDSPVKLSIYKGNPVAGDTDGGKYVLALKGDKGIGGALSTTFRFAFDNQKTYRISVRVYAPMKMGGTIGGYANLAVGGQIPNWQYNVSVAGPTKGWQTFQTTVGPPGSGAVSTWPPGAASLGMAFWPYGEPGTFYMDNFSFQEIEAPNKK